MLNAQQQDRGLADGARVQKRISLMRYEVISSSLTGSINLNEQTVDEEGAPIVPTERVHQHCPEHTE